MAQGKGSPAVSREARHTWKEKHRGYEAESDANLLCRDGRERQWQWHTDRRQEPNEMVPKLFGPIRERYANRPGGYTRVLRIEPLKEDQAESAILELVDGPRDMRFALTAKTLARRPAKLGLSPGLTTHVKKVTQFREGGVESLREMVERLRIEQKEGIDERILPPPRKVYPEDKMKRDMHYFEDVDYYKPANPVKRRGARKEQAKQELIEDVVVEEQAAAPETKKEVS